MLHARIVQAQVGARQTPGPQGKCGNTSMYMLGWCTIAAVNAERLMHGPR